MKDVEVAFKWLAHHSKTFGLYSKPTPRDVSKNWLQHLAKRFNGKEWDYAYREFNPTLYAVEALKKQIVSCMNYRDGGTYELILNDGIVIIFPFIIPSKGRCQYSNLVIVAYPEGTSQYI